MLHWSFFSSLLFYLFSLSLSLFNNSTLLKSLFYTILKYCFTVLFLCASASGVLELDFTSSLKPILCIFFQHHVQWLHVGSLKLTYDVSTYTREIDNTTFHCSLPLSFSFPLKAYLPLGLVLPHKSFLSFFF